jgi:membrane protein DedA with SNARE-associated domain
VEHFLQSWGYAAIFVLAVVEAACIPFPSEITFGFSGALAAEGQLNLAAVIVVGIVGEFIGSLLGYLLGRTGGRTVVERYGKYVLVSPADLDRAHRFLQRRGDPSVAVGRVLPLIRTFVSLVAGVGEMAPVPFALFSFVGTAVYVAAVSSAGYALGSSWHKLVRGFTAAGIVLLVLAVIAIAVFIWHRWRSVKAHR